MKLGPRTTDQMRRLRQTWRQGEHVLISGSTGSGKTALARHLDQIRIDNGGHVLVAVMKPVPDETILKDYTGFTRWTKWKKNPAPHENKVLLWPDTKRARNKNEILDIQRDVFADMVDGLLKQGKWNLHVDEGLYMCSPTFLNMAGDLAMLHAIGRSSKLTITTLTQRPSHLPLILYSSASHAFIGRAREATDNKRLSELGAKSSAKELSGRINSQGRHDFLWVPVTPDWEPETVNLRQ